MFCNMTCVVISEFVFFDEMIYIEVWNVPDSWGAVGLRTVPLFTEWGGVGREFEMRVAHLAKAGSCRDKKRFRKC